LTHSQGVAGIEAIHSPPPYQVRNAWALAGDMVLFTAGLAFISQTVVFPSFVAALTDSEEMVGLASGLGSGAWLLPQLLVATQLARVRRKKDLLVRAALVGRSFLLLIGLGIWLLGQQHPALAVAIGLVGIFIFFASDGVATVAWYDLLAKVIPNTHRGRILGASQMVGGLVAIGCGVAVKFILSEESRWPFPNNYALLFGLASVTLLAGVVSLNCIREPEYESPDKDTASPREALALLPAMLAGDRPFLRLVVTKLLNGCVSVASAFYILYATTKLGLSADSAGLFVSAQMVGSLTAALLISTIQDRWGPILHMRIATCLSAMPPIMALCVGHFSDVLGQGALYPYLLTYFFLGISMGSMSWPYANWIIEYASNTQRPLYIGALNTLGAFTMLAPVLGGWLARSVSYSAVFILALVFSVSSLLASLPLPDPRSPAR